MKTLHQNEPYINTQVLAINILYKIYCYGLCAPKTIHRVDKFQTYWHKIHRNCWLEKEWYTKDSACIHEYKLDRNGFFLFIHVSGDIRFTLKCLKAHQMGKLIIELDKFAHIPFWVWFCIGFLGFCCVTTSCPRVTMVKVYTLI